VASLSADTRRKLTLAACVIGSSLAFIDATVVIVALPTIQEDLDLGLSGQQWVYLSYSLALAALYLPAGAVGDRWGRRQTFVAGVVAFALASALAGAAPNGATLIGARLLQGVAGAFVTTNSLALLREVYGGESGRAVGLWTSLTGVATIAGPPAGGALVEWSWRSIFYLNLPLAALTVALAVAGTCEVRARQRVGALDVPGAALAAVAFGALTYGMVEGAERGFSDVWWAFALAAVAAPTLIVVELRTREPMLPLGLFRRRNFAAVNLETFFVYAALGAVLLFWTLYLQFLGFTPFEAGLLNVPLTVVMILLAARIGGLADRHGPRGYLTAGPLLLGLGMLAWTAVDERSDFWSFGVAGLVLFSLGLACVVAPITATALSSVPTRYAGVASGVNSTVSRVGGLLAVAVVGLVVTLVFDASASGGIPLERGQNDPELRAASVDAFRAAMLVTAFLAFAGAAVAAFGISNDEAARAAEEDAEAMPSPDPATVGS
jgi:EmrB/QacA subfamily drug resistance transporter